MTRLRCGLACVGRPFPAAFRPFHGQFGAAPGRLQNLSLFGAAAVASRGVAGLSSTGATAGLGLLRQSAMADQAERSAAHQAMALNLRLAGTHRGCDVIESLNAAADARAQVRVLPTVSCWHVSRAS